MSDPSLSDHSAITASTDQFADLGAVTLCYRTYGKAGDPTMVLVMGLGGQLNWWHPDLCARLAAAGYRVVVFDNRDVGLSSQVEGRVKRLDMVAGFVGRRTTPPYSLSDMAADTTGLLDHLQVEQAHIVGISMGGMIAQTVAIEHPERVSSLTSIMSTTGNRRVGWQSPRVLPTLLGSPPRDRESYLERTVRMWTLIGSPQYPNDPQDIRARAAESYDRGIHPAGTARQIAAILSQRDRTAALAEVSAPTLVIHGMADRMVHVSGGRATAAAVGGSELILVPGMGHDLPVALHEPFAEAIVRTAKRGR